MIKVAIDTGPLTSGHKVRGIGVHTKELIENIDLIKGSDIKVEGVDFSQTDLSSYDIAHYTSFNPFFFSLPFTKPTKKVVLTIHDLIYLIYPNHYPAGIKGEVKFLIQKYLLKNVDAIITISETSKKDICRFLNFDPDKVFVTYLAQKSIFKPTGDKLKLKEIKEKYNLKNSFVLYVGDINYNKNIPTLIDACNLAKIQLVIVGKHAKDLVDCGIDSLKTLKGPQDYIRYLLNKPHPELAHYSRLLGKMKKANVLTLGFVSDEDLASIFNLATVYCQPSLYEGFGLSVLDAQASGVPTLCAKTQSLVEIAGDSSLYADPKDKEDFAKKIRQLKEDAILRVKLVKNGFENIKKYSWQKTAKETLEVYKKII